MNISLLNYISYPFGDTAEIHNYTNKRNNLAFFSKIFTKISVSKILINLILSNGYVFHYYTFTLFICLYSIYIYTK